MGNVVEIDRSNPERGQASVLIALDKSRITVVHGSTGQKLMDGKVDDGWWNELFVFLEEHLDREPEPDPPERSAA